jgi:hypothetical protein
VWLTMQRMDCRLDLPCAERRYSDEQSRAFFPYTVRWRSINHLVGRHKSFGLDDLSKGLRLNRSTGLMPRHAHVLQRGLVRKISMGKEEESSSLMEWLGGWMEDMLICSRGCRYSVFKFRYIEHLI